MGEIKERQTEYIIVPAESGGYNKKIKILKKGLTFLCSDGIIQRLRVSFFFCV